MFGSKQRALEAELAEVVADRDRLRGELAEVKKELCRRLSEAKPEIVESDEIARLKLERDSAVLHRDSLLESRDRSLRRADALEPLVPKLRDLRAAVESVLAYHQAGDPSDGSRLDRLADLKAAYEATPLGDV